MISAMVLAAATVLSGGPHRQVACEGPDIDPFVTVLRDRVVNFDGMAGYATDTFGAPLECEGAVTSEFDGAKYGTVRLSYAGGVVFELETMPPEISVVALRAPDGFEDEAAARSLLREYAIGRGANPDWDDPETTTEDGERIERYWDPEPGLNASASYVFRGDVLVALRFSMAP